VRKITVGLAVVVASIFVGLGVASASPATVKSEQKFINVQIKSAIFPTLKWRSCSSGSANGKCASTDGDAKFGNLLTFGVYGTSLSLVETGAARTSSVEAAMNQIMGQIIYQYAGTKAANWSSGVADDGTPARNETKSFGSWSVQVETSSSKYGTLEVLVTKSS
jgi:hypothetical protein